MPAMRRVLGLVCLVLLGGSPTAAADARDVLNRARTLYNQRQFDAAIAAAEEASRSVEWAHQAHLIAARAFLERFRGQPDAQDLVNARERFRRIDPSRFSATERFEYLVGLGETLYLDADTGAAAEVFESVLGPGGVLPADARERILDWWASAL